MLRLRELTLGLIFAASFIANAGERINHEGRLLGAAPVVTQPILFNTPEADAIVSAMQIFPTDNPWNEDISKRPVLGNSDAMIAKVKQELAAKGANRQTLRPFFEMNYVLVPDSQPRVNIFFNLYADESDGVDQSTLVFNSNSVTGTGSYPIPTVMPVETWPASTGNLTNEQWQRDINADGGDRHSIIVMPGAGTIWETWQTYLTNNSPVWEASNGAKFNLNSNALRTAGFTSGDAAGLPMFPALVRYDECERGVVEHALRLIVAHTRVGYIYPGNHNASSPSTTDATVPAMGQRFRLKSTFVVPDNWTKQEKAVCAAFKKYGGIVADNGGFFSISVCPDNRFPSGCFNNLSSIDINNFEVIETTGPTEGPRSAGAPTVTAGADFSLDPTATAQLSATVTGTNPTVQWYLYPFATAPGTVTFGTPNTAQTTATFSAVGSYTLMVKVDDGVHTPVYDVLVVNVVVGGGNGGGGGGGNGGGSGGGTGASDDFDGDGVMNSADDDDDNDGTLDVNDASPFDFFAGGASTAMTIKSLKGSVKFGKTDSDAVSIQGTLPKLPANLDVSAKDIVINVGGAVLTFTLDAKAKGKSLQGNAALTLKPSKRNKTTKKVDFLGGDVAFKIKMAKGTWSDDWTDEGILTTLDTKATNVPFALTLTLGGKPYIATVTTVYKGKADKGGTFSFKAPKP